ncbi:MAG: valine--tRNA ligase [Ignavibacteria bacterium 13_1_40CM_2_61_4]|nr:MAG: valine--tRNA ligase [Ignavibacteria bacterium 13_1_40CM_2_61_4]
MSELTTAYVPASTEERWYRYWETRGLFHARARTDRKPYTIVIPPPNITGILTMGHVLNNSIQDVFIRWRRMQGYEALWLPGTDHAGIATQNVVERALAKEGKTRRDLGREEFLKRVWKWKEEYGGTIIKQLKKLGASCDWERERFTMDEGLSEAVQEIFIRLHSKGYIYRGKYIVNWCPRDLTAISDDEVEQTEHQGKLFYLRYPIKSSKEYAVVATTRPETILGDTAVAVHPDDERYRHLVGSTAILPIINRELPIIADDFVDPKFGTGMVKITPAHDPNDYWVGKRHNLPFINVLTPTAQIDENAPPKYRGLDRLDARKAIVQDLEAAGVLVKAENHVHTIGRCYRCGTVIEPYLSDQWFVKMKPFAGPALKAVLDGHIRFHPGRWVKTYENWLTNIRDWCISRQLWWGHRIPVWYCVGDDACKLECREPIVSRTRPERCPHCGSTNLRQDEDVLDTWFSAWLWPFSTLGWPRDNPDLRYFYPTDTLVTGPDIIFFWVARMIMAGLEVMGEVPLPDGSMRKGADDIVPFRDVYFTSIVRDAEGRKMSKSLGNSPDPLDVIAQYGADALRFTILYLAPLGQDVHYANEKCEMGRNFANKVWNAGRFLLLNKEQLLPSAGPKGPSGPGIPEDHLDLADRWLLSRLHSTIGELTSLLDRFEINQATKILYDFLWHDFCDWYVEMVKGRLYGDEPAGAKAAVLNRAIGIFDQSLRLLHPFMPFITEELWQHLAPRTDGESIMVAAFPRMEERWLDKKTEEEMAFVQHAINSVRNVRGELSVPPSKEIELVIRFSDAGREKIIEKYLRYFQRLARVTKIQQLRNGEKPPHAASAVVDGGEIFIPLEGVIDLDAERERLRKEIAHTQRMLDSIQKKLGNEHFVGKAPKEVVDREREKLGHFRANLDKLQKHLAEL